MLAPKSVSTMMWIIANNVHKYVATALKNVEGWLDKTKQIELERPSLLFSDIM